MASTSLNPDTHIVFIGGGNMASAIIGGLLRMRLPAQHVTVVDPYADARQRLERALGVRTEAAPGAFIQRARLLAWAVKPQQFQAAAASVAPHLNDCVQLSIMAGIRIADIAAASGSDRIVRCMPNTPALVGQGMTALHATAAVDAGQRELAETVMQAAGHTLWVEREPLLDAVTALSGSGPAYVFYFLEAMERAGTELGLSAAQARQLAVQTFVGSAALAADSAEPLATLRERVTSKGGTTFAALTALQGAGVADAFVAAMHAAHQRARELGDAFGAGTP